MTGMLDSWNSKTGRLSGGPSPKSGRLGSQNLMAGGPGGWNPENGGPYCQTHMNSEPESFWEAYLFACNEKGVAIHPASSNGEFWNNTSLDDDEKS